MRRDGFYLPGPVRRQRTWWLREAQWHMAMARLGHYQEYNRDAAARDRGYAAEILRRWHVNGHMPSYATTERSLRAQEFGHRLSLAKLGVVPRLPIKRR